MARRLLVKEGINSEVSMICLCPGSVNSEAKRWPAEYFAYLADLLVDETGSQIIFLGAIQEEDLIEGIIGRMRRKATRSTLPQSPTLCHLSGS